MWPAYISKTINLPATTWVPNTKWDRSPALFFLSNKMWNYAACVPDSGRAAQRAAADRRAAELVRTSSTSQTKPKTPRLLFSCAARRHASDWSLFWGFTLDLTPDRSGKDDYMWSKQSRRKCALFGAERVVCHNIKLGAHQGQQQPVALVSSSANASLLTLQVFRQQITKHNL